MPNIDYGGLSNVYTFMYWQSITDTTSDQYRLKTESGMNFDSDGFGKIDGCYVIACTDPADNGGMFGTVGDYVDWVLPDGSTLHTVVGDTKSSSDPNWIPIGHQEGNTVSVVEFIVDRNNWGKDNPGTPSNHPEWAGQLQSWTNVGNFWNDRPQQSVTFYDSLTENQRLFSMYLVGKMFGMCAWSYENHKIAGKAQFRMGYLPWYMDNLYRFYMYMYTPENLTSGEVNEFGKRVWATYTQEFRTKAGYKFDSMYKNAPDNKDCMTDDMALAWVNAMKDNEDAVRYQEWFWCYCKTPGYTSRICTLYGVLQDIESKMEDLRGKSLPDSPTLDDIKCIFFMAALDTQTYYKVCNLLVRYPNGPLLSLYNMALSWFKMNTQVDNAAYKLSQIQWLYSTLVDWDGETLPEGGFLNGIGTMPGYGENGNGSETYPGLDDAVTSWSSQVKYVDFYGTQMIIHGAGGSKLQLYKTNGNVWYPKAGSGTTSSGDSNTGDNKPYDPDTGTGDENYTQIPVFDALKKFYLDHENAYDYAPAYDGDERNYTDPRVDGCTNCSAFITWCATQIAPDSDMARSGYYTGVMAGMGEKVASGSGGQFPYNLARPGDVLLLNHNGYNPDYDHVELFMGTTAQGNDTGSELWGAGSAPCPHRNYSAQALINNGYWTDWQVRRISWGD